MDEDFYWRITESFYRYYEDVLANCKSCALNIANSNYGASPDQKISQTAIESNPYFGYRAVLSLREYQNNISNISSLGLYFFDSDYVLTSSYKYDRADYLSLLAGENGETRERLNRFFDGGSSQVMRIFSSFDTYPAASAKLLVGIPIRLDHQTPALIFFVLDRNSILNGFSKFNYEGELKLFIYNAEGSLFFSNTELPDGLQSDGDFLSAVSSTEKKSLSLTADERVYSMFKATYGPSKYAFVSLVEQDYREKSTSFFYRTILFSFLLLILLFLLLLVITGYITYQPIHRVIDRIARKPSSPGPEKIGEIDAILRAIDDMEGTVSEQQDVIRDYILMNLINGIPMTAGELELFPDSLHAPSYCVLTGSAIRFTLAERKQFCRSVLEQCNAEIYIIELLTQSQTAFVCLLGDGVEPEQVANCIRSCLTGLFQMECPIGIGQTVFVPDELNVSYQHSLLSLEMQTGGSPRHRNHVALDGNLTESLDIMAQCIQNDDAVSATKILQDIVRYISENVASTSYRRYLRYTILAEYVRCVRQKGRRLDDADSDRLLSSSNLRELYRALASSIQRVCSGGAHAQDNAYGRLKAEIIEYVDGHCSDPEICRTQVADRFGISIYSLSRLFKECTGFGFKEYITEKRLELARKLILTTDKNLNQIAETVGFLNAEHFSKMFKARYGVAPSRYKSQSGAPSSV